ncbi:glycosyltransferase family 4 protein [Rubinisphaera italica]|uniref:Glycosyl transferases group 1 n=1 Tax=Rubinisphaera italica TaxID=2527969 RepID=A0A5C5XA81_9PLAN|nr:glycosyltransferase family 4 protein [Rubinisphaera italica]TWT59609.1 Glycosyl transferases group 1 [Rubinisphaera italica]
MHPRKIYFVANHKSVHLLRWKKLSDICNLEVRILSTVPQDKTAGDECMHLIPSMYGIRNIPKIFNVMISGIKLRWMSKTLSGSILHAHSASGNSMVAYMSGCPYVVTTYGSEVYCYQQYGWLSRWLMRKVLSHALCITASSPAMAEAVKSILGSSTQVKIHTFPLGYDSDIFQPINEDQRLQIRETYGIEDGMPVFCINRRATELYRTKEMIAGFMRYLDKGGDAYLLVISGDADSVYLKETENLAKIGIDSGRIQILKGIMTQKEVSDVLHISDYAISVPMTDQLSCSILESMACGCVPILSDIPAYGELRDTSGAIWVSSFDPDSLSELFKKATHSIRANNMVLSSNVADLVKEKYSNNVIASHVIGMYVYAYEQICATVN